MAQMHLNFTPAQKLLPRAGRQASKKAVSLVFQSWNEILFYLNLQLYVLLLFKRYS